MLNAITVELIPLLILYVEPTHFSSISTTTDAHQFLGICFFAQSDPRKFVNSYAKNTSSGYLRASLLVQLP